LAIWFNESRARVNNGEAPLGKSEASPRDAP